MGEPQLIKKEPLHNSLPSPESWGGGARVTPCVLETPELAAQKGWVLGSSHPPPSSPYGSGPWRSTVLGRSNPESPANRGPLAEDPVVHYRLSGQAAELRCVGAYARVGVTPAGSGAGPAAKSCLGAWGTMIPDRPQRGEIQRLPGSSAASSSSSSGPRGRSSGPAKGLSAAGSGGAGLAACSGGASRGASRRDDLVVLGPAAAPEVPDGPVVLEPLEGGPTAPPEVPAPTGCQMRL